MATLNGKRQLSYEDIRENVAAEQVLSIFGIGINSYNKCCCPFHDDKNPSMIVHETWAYCFACAQSWDVFTLARKLLSRDKEASINQTFSWFDENWEKFPQRQDRIYEKTGYEGPVDIGFIDYWHSLLSDDLANRLKIERLFTQDTIQRYKIGYRPDWNAVVFPFWRGDPGNSLVDIVQFRLLDEDAKTKYIGMKGHNRASFMNAYLLEYEQPYLVVMLGTPDAILAAQDGVIAVGLNGNSIGKADLPRIKDLLSKQSLIYVLPDNTQSEFKPAAKLASQLGAELIFYPRNMPKDTDYIKYRHTNTANDFLTEVVPIYPYIKTGQDAVDNVYSIMEARDPYGFVQHFLGPTRGMLATDVARNLANAGCPKKFPKQDWRMIESKLRAVKTEEHLQHALGLWKDRISALSGAW